MIFFTFCLIIFHIFCWSFHFEVHRHVVLVKVGRMVVVGFVFVAAASGHKEMVLNCIAPKIVCAGKKGQEMPKAQLFSYYGSPNLTRSGSGVIHTKTFWLRSFTFYSFYSPNGSNFQIIVVLIIIPLVIFMMCLRSGCSGRSTHWQIQLSLTAHMQILRVLTAVQSWRSWSIGCYGSSVQMLKFFPLCAKVVSFVRHLVQFVRQNFDLIKSTCFSKDCFSPNFCNPHIRYEIVNLYFPALLLFCSFMTKIAVEFKLVLQVSKCAGN